MAASRVERAAAPLAAGTPWPVLAALGALAGAAAVLGGHGLLPPRAAALIAVAAMNAAFIATALAWAGAPGAGAVAAGLVLAASGAAAGHPAGAIAYLALPAWLASLARGGRLVGLGLGARPPAPALLAGAALGVGLIAHLALTVSRTRGYGFALGPPSVVLSSLAYDVGVNVPCAECFLRGALFNRAQRRWSLHGAMALAVALGLARYLADPLLPHASEVLAGAVFYVALLGMGNCWLFWRWGSLVPGTLSGILLFEGYRLLVVS
ncbi:MAG: CPBP family intramembrane metalloprotease [Candidatus Rokubacteria bacterium]|nr:CPBP family intramembrane metalloprotease [Candidatus Rokubacteria bacterium]